HSHPSRPARLFASLLAQGQVPGLRYRKKESRWSALLSPPALRAGFPVVYRVWISDDHVATFEHAVVDGHHGLPVGAALGAHVDNPPPRMPPALTHRAPPSRLPPAYRSRGRSGSRTRVEIPDHSFRLPFQPRDEGAGVVYASFDYALSYLPKRTRFPPAVWDVVLRVLLLHLVAPPTDKPVFIWHVLALGKKLLSKLQPEVCLSLG